MDYNIKWDQDTKRLYETGVRNGVLYLKDANGAYPKGVAWNGLISVDEKPSGAEASPLYADDIKYLNLLSNEEFGATIGAYIYPDEFAECDGSASLAKGVTVGQQTRKTFGLCYRTAIGNDIDGADHGYKLHLVYGCLAAPSEKSYSTINDTPEAITFSWEITTTPVKIDDIEDGDVVKTFKPTAILTIDSTKVDATKLAAFKEILYGKEASSQGGTTTPAVEGRLPLPNEVADFFNAEG